MTWATSNLSVEQPARKAAQAAHFHVNRHRCRSARTSGKIVPQRLETAMTTLVDELSARAKTLSVQDRARLAEELLASLDQEPDSEVKKYETMTFVEAKQLSNEDFRKWAAIHHKELSANYFSEIGKLF